jgi:hypothetical protein
MNRIIFLSCGALAGLLTPAGAEPAMPYASAYQGTTAYLESNPGLTGGNEAGDVAAYLLGNVINTMFHELGHAMTSEFGIPIAGKEEDAVDTLANIIMISKESDPVLDMMIESVADDYFKSGEFNDEQNGGFDAADEHSLDSQRAYAMICMLVGADPEAYKDAADNAAMSPERQESCQGEYENAVDAWNKLLASDFRDEGEEPKTGIPITYGAAPAELAEVASLLKASRVVETVINEANHLVRFEPGITVGVEACDEENAYWSPDDRKLTLCYELVQGYLDRAIVQ